MLRAPLLRIPYTDPLPAPRIIPANATTPSGAIAALVDFLSPSLSSSSRRRPQGLDRNGADPTGKTLLLTGAGISVASGLADYRGSHGTYTLNKTYRPIYFHEFCASHEARKRYWARSFLGWTTLNRSRPNKGHEAVGRLGEMGVVSNVITQNVDSFHLMDAYLALLDDGVDWRLHDGRCEHGFLYVIKDILNVDGSIEL